MTTNNARLTQALNDAAVSILTDAGQGICTIGMVTRMPVPVRGPWWRFWRPWETRMLEELRILPAAITVVDSNSIQVTTGAGWAWRKGEQFVEFRLFDSAGHTLISGGNLSVIPRPGDIVHLPRISWSSVLVEL